MRRAGSGRDGLHSAGCVLRTCRGLSLAGIWLFRAARNRIIDRFRKKREQALSRLMDARNAYALAMFLEAISLAPDELA